MTDSNYSHVAEPVRALCDAPLHTRAKAVLTDRFIKYPLADKIMNEVSYLMARPASIRASGVCLSAPPGFGKTKIGYAAKRSAATLFPPRDNIQNEPALMISMTAARNATIIHNRLLQALKTDLRSSSRSDRERNLMRVLRAAAVRIIIVDEIQDLLSSTQRQHRDALDTLKFLMNELQIPLLVLGTALAREALQTDEHLNARFTHWELSKWKIDKQARGFLAGFETALPLRNPSRLGSPELTRTIIECSGGVMSKIVTLVNHAAIFAMLDGSEKITDKLIERAVVETPPAGVLRESLQTRAVA